jgi:hypothetical protein
MRLRLVAGFWLVVAGSILMVVLLVIFAPGARGRVRDFDDPVTSKPFTGNLAPPMNHANKVNPAQSRPPAGTSTPPGIPITGAQSGSTFPALVYVLLIGTVLLLTSELLVISRPPPK